MASNPIEDAPGPEAIRQVRRLHAAGVTAVTFVDDLGFRGVTVTAFAVVSLDPPRVLVCLDRASEALDAITRSGHFAINLLGDHQEFLADRFAGRAPIVNRKFDGVPHHVTPFGSPVLDDSLAWFDCALDRIVSGGDHDVVIGDVREAAKGSATLPLLYFDGAYGELRAD